MKLSERFINAIDGDSVISSKNAHAIEDAVNFIRKYEDAEEQGQLVILPCKVGNALFVTDEGTILPAVRMVQSVTWCNGKILIHAVNNRTGVSYYCSAEDFGKTVFLTREEAKAAMSRGQENERHHDFRQGV